MPYPLPSRDIRRKKPPLLSFVLRQESLRRVARVLSLLAVDYVAIYAAIFTALWLKAFLRDVPYPGHLAEAGTRHYFPFVFLVAILLFARSSLYAQRGERPGMARIVACLFQVMVVALIFALASGERFSSYYIFYGGLFFGTVYISTARYGYERATGGCCARPATGGAQCSSAPARRSTRWPTRSRTRPRRRSRSSATSRSTRGRTTACAHSERSTSFPASSRGPRAGGDHRRPRLPPGEGGGPRRPLPPARRDRAHRADSTMEILMQRAEFVPGQSVPLFELRPPVFEGVDFA